MNSKLKQKLFFIGHIVTLVSLGFLVYSFKDLVQKDAAVDLSYLLKATIFVLPLYTIALVVSCWGWKLCISFALKGNLPWKSAWVIFIKSNVAKYLPTNVFQFLARHHHASFFNLPQKQVAVSSLLEICYSVFYSMLFICFSFFFMGSEKIIRSHKLLAVVGVIVIVICGTIFVLKSKLINTFLGTPRQFFHLTLKQLAIYTLNYVLVGLMIVGLVQIYALTNKLSMTDIDPILIFFAFYVGSFVGFVTPGAPAGIGVREAVVIFLVGASAPKSLILESLVIYRVIGSFCEILLFFITISTVFFVKKVKLRSTGSTYI